MQNRFLLYLCLFLLCSCHYPQQTEEYGPGYNFIVTADSLLLQENRPWHSVITPEYMDSTIVYANDALVVAEQLIIPEDSIDSVWVKVARDPMTVGWLHETTLLASVVPDDPISQGIYYFSNEHLLGAICLFLFTLIVWLLRRMMRQRFHMVHVDDIASPYPMALCLTMAGAAVLYSSIQLFVPETWCFFYFHPTLNPFGLPFVMTAFLCSVWLMIILLIASLDDIRRSLPADEAILYTLALCAILGIIYVTFSLATLYYIGYPLLALYIVGAVWQYVRRHYARYVCPYCGARLHQLGTCTKCGKSL